VQSHSVEIEKDDQAHPSKTLFAIGEGMIPGDAMAEHRGFHQQIRREVHVVKARLGGVKGGVEQVGTRGRYEYLRVDSGDLFGDHEGFAECEVSHSASRSRIF